MPLPPSAHNGFTFYKLFREKSEAVEAFHVIAYYFSEQKNRILTKPPKPPTFDKEIIHVFSKKLELKFYSKPPREGEVCFAQSSELQNEFKSFFTAQDLWDYILAEAHDQLINERLQPFSEAAFQLFPYPIHDDDFWQRVRWGRQLRDKNTPN